MSHNEGQIELLDSAGKPVLTIRTASYDPQHMAFAPDHTLWTIGYEYGYESREGHFDVLRHYRRNGEEINRGLSWLQIAGDYNAYTSLHLCLGGKQLYTANDRIGFRTGLLRGRGSWIEISPAGTLLGKYDLGNYRELYYEPATVVASGSVYARIFKNDQMDGWAVLDRSKRLWRKVSGYPKGRIIGSDGENIIFSQHDGAWTVLKSVPAASLQAEPLW